jgi:hypothetical protein
LVVFLVADNAYSQKQKIINLQGYDDKPYHFGFILGTGVMLFSSNSDSLNLGREIKSNGPSYSVGILGNLRLAKHFDLRLVPSLSMSSSRSIIQNGTSYSDSTYNDFRTILLVLPLEIKARSKRYNNMAGYLLAGIAYTFDFSKKSVADANIRLPRSDFMPEVGVGVDIYTEYFKFGIEAKMAYGLVNMNKQTPLKEGGLSIPVSNDEFHSKIFFLTFTFE